MDYVLASDFYEIRLASLVTNVDKDVLVELYQPLIGANATILYLTLLKQKRHEDDEMTYSSQQLLGLMQFDPNTLLASRHYLEAVGLMRTYEKVSESGRYYIYVLYAPKSPKDFFDDVLFKGLLIQAIGEKEAKKLAFNYKLHLEIDESFKEISSSFVDVFHPDYDDSAFRKNLGDDIVGHDAGRVKIKFNYDLFFGYVNDNSQIRQSSFSGKDMKEIERLATLFGLDEKQMAFICIDEYDPTTTPHLNFSGIKNRAEQEIRYNYPKADKQANKRWVKREKIEIKSETDLAKKIGVMDQIPPAKYLYMQQNRTMPALSDLAIINSLSENYKLPNGIVNVIIEYVLNKNNNVLSRKYCEKIATTLAREGVTSTLEAMDVLNKLSLNKKTQAEYVEKQEDYKEKKEISVEEDNELQALLLKFEENKKGGK